MSSEFVYERRAVNLYGAKGAYTALFIKSHSSNTYPHLPEWNLYALEKKENAMDSACRYAYYCEDGCTRGARGVGITGDSEIGRWRDAISSAYTTPQNFTVLLTFCEKPAPWDLSLLTMVKFQDFAAGVGIQLLADFVYQRIGGKETIVGHQLRLNLSYAHHVDLMWDATRDLTDLEKTDQNKQLIQPHCFMKSIERQMANSYLFWQKDPLATQLSAKTSKMELAESMFKFAFPVEGQTDYRHEVFVCVNQNGLVLYSGRDPHNWFCKTKLMQEEAAHPGTAESAYRKFKKLIKALPTTPHEGLAVLMKEVASLRLPQAIPDWAVAKVTQLFKKAEYLVGTANIWKAHADDLVGALSSAEYGEVYLSVPNRAAKSPSAEQATLFC